MAEQFDALLRSALMDANLYEYRDVMERAKTPDFSSRYRRECMRMLADPLRWMKRKIQPVWQKVLRNAACFLLACLVALGGLMAASPTVRAAVLNWLRELNGRLIVYRSTNVEAEPTAAWDWRPAWLPDGWVLDDLNGSGGSAHWTFRESQGRGVISFFALPPGQTDISTGIMDAEAEETLTSVPVQDYTADYYEGPDSAVLAWEDNAGRFFCLDGSWLDEPSILIQIAEHVQIHPESGTAYEAAWVPEGYRRFTNMQLNGAGYDFWMPEDGNGLTFYYVQDAPVPFKTPDREPETVEVCGIPAQYWRGRKPAPNPSGTTITYTVDGKTVTTDSPIIEAGGATIVTGSYPVGVLESSLCWNDSDTGTAFILRGSLEKDSLIQIAENVRRCERRPMEDTPAAYFSLSGTTGTEEETKEMEEIQ